MKQLLCAALLAITLATPVFAAKLYLKDGGVIQAKRVWRADGRVYVLATRDTQTSFEPWEVNLKRTFPKHHRMVKIVRGGLPHAATAAPTQSATPQKTENKNGFSLPSLPEKSPDSLAPSSGTGGTIRQQKKEMEERLKE
jgi:hypothetical protein